MSLRFFIELDCIPREVLGNADLIEMLIKREQAAHVAVEYQEKHQIQDVEKMPFRLEVRSAEEGEKESREVTVGQIRRETLPLDELHHHCAKCPVSLDQQPFGCIQPLVFPVQGEGEDWLLGLINEDAPEAIAAGIRAFSPDSDALKRLKSMRTSRLFTRSEGTSRTVGGVTFHADEILATLFFRNHWEPIDLLGPLLLFDVIALADGRRGDALHQLFNGILEEGEEIPSILFKPDLEKHPITNDTSRDFLILLLSQYLSLASGVPFKVWS